MTRTAHQHRPRRRRGRLARLLSTTLLGGVLAVSALVVPDSTVAPTDMALVKVPRAQGVDAPRDVVWILAVGSDARPGQLMTETRGDALQLVGINTRTGAATGFAIPRDSYVPIPGHGSDKINAALFFGGPQVLARAVGDLVGIRPHYVFVTRFEKFEEMINAIGGVTVHNPRRFHDDSIKPKGFRAGRLHLGGYDALAFSRIRYNLPRGDFDRSLNQQRTLRGIQRQVADRARQRGFIERGVLSALKNMATDASPTEVYRLARAVAAVRPGRITTCLVEGGIGNVGGASVVIPDVARIRRLGDRARDDATLEGGC
ncbi:LCP family protein [Nocardioides sp. SYSU D00038]|uniref:LCP family protein n=1 Tax=Nocardioides sp. SYSU D00038 TaxID=2812554 RepID=UPI001967AAD3|nr:LCP family protein [Nocardioides sp. SYSU D00038]